jgi:hypothetical protein
MVVMRGTTLEATPLRARAWRQIVRTRVTVSFSVATRPTLCSFVPGRVTTANFTVELPASITNLG